MTKLFIKILLILCFVVGANKAMAEPPVYLGWYHWSQADFNGDFIVNITDLSMLAEDWQTTDYNQTYKNNRYGGGTDINRDGIVNLLDLSDFTVEWLRDARSQEIGKMKANVESQYVRADEPDGPFFVFHYYIYNAYNGTDMSYNIAGIKFMSGSKDGVHPNSNTPEYWSPYTTTDPNESYTQTWATYSPILPNQYKQFGLWVVDDNIDPNDYGFDYIEAKSDGDIHDPYPVPYYPILPIKAPMPKRD